MPLLPVLARMEKAGVKIDLGRLSAMSEEFGATLADLEARIYGHVGHEFNIGSPSQLETVLFDELELPSTKRTRTSRSTDASVLEELRDEHEVIGLILEHRQVSKLKSTYVDALPTLVDGDGAPAHHLPAGGGRHRAPVEHRSEPPEHPDPHGARPPHPPRVRGAARPAAARRRLLAAGAAHPRPRLADPGLKADFAAHADIHLAAAARVLGLAPDQVGPEGAQRGEDDQLRDRLRPLRLRAGPAAEHSARGGARLHRGLLRSAIRGSAATRPR